EYPDVREQRAAGRGNLAGGWVATALLAAVCVASGCHGSGAGGKDGAPAGDATGDRAASDRSSESGAGGDAGAGDRAGADAARDASDAGVDERVDAADGAPAVDAADAGDGGQAGEAGGEAGTDGGSELPCTGSRVPGDYATLGEAVQALELVGGTICLGARTYPAVTVIPAAPLNIQGLSAARTIVAGMTVSGSSTASPILTITGL